MSEVTIVQRVMTHYRVPFFERLRAALAAQGIELRVIVGQPTLQERDKGDQGHLDWAEPINNSDVRVTTRHRLAWQPCLRSLRTSDLVVVEQASKLLLNYLLLAWRPFGGPRVAVWGHGVNSDRESASPAGEFVKRKLAARADWWFCYTEGTARIVDALGVPGDRRTVVQNAVDTTAIQVYRRSITEAELEELRRELGVGSGPVAVALGSIYPTKRPEFLVVAADAIRARMADFELVVIGDGPDRPTIDRAAATRPWMHIVGARTGRDMVRHAALGTIVLNPGLVGLAVLDAFALGLPMVTCDLPYHSPEIEYLVDGKNGVVMPRETLSAEYAACVVALFHDDERLARLRGDAIECACCYTTDEMVDRFTAGILSALQSSA